MLKKVLKRQGIWARFFAVCFFFSLSQFSLFSPSIFLDEFFYFLFFICSSSLSLSLFLTLSLSFIPHSKSCCVDALQLCAVLCLYLWFAKWFSHTKTLLQCATQISSLAQGVIIFSFLFSLFQLIFKVS